MDDFGFMVISSVLQSYWMAVLGKREAVDKIIQMPVKNLDHDKNRTHDLRYG